MVDYAFHFWLCQLIALTVHPGRKGKFFVFCIVILVTFYMAEDELNVTILECHFRSMLCLYGQVGVLSSFRVGLNLTTSSLS